MNVGSLMKQSASQLSRFTNKENLMPMRKWKTVPICDRCWSLDHPTRLPVRIDPSEVEECFRCDKSTLSGIYVRAAIVVPEDGES